jgi:hypothetical protein
MSANYVTPGNSSQTHQTGAEQPNSGRNWNDKIIDVDRSDIEVGVEASERTVDHG